MKRLKVLLWALMMMGVVVTSCNRSELPPSLNVSSERFKTNISGSVIDDNNKPVSGAKVTFMGATATTDANGAFLFKNMLAPKQSTVRIEKSGFFPGSRTFRVEANTTEIVHIKLLSKKVRGTFSGTTGGSVTFGGTTISLPAAGVMKADGSLYSGTVKVAAQYLDPEDDDLAAKMPGDLLGVNTQGQSRGLETFGMVAVELMGANNEPLNVAKGQKATLTMTVPPSKMGNAPTSIPLWYYDETLGMWKEEGSALLTGNQYVGDVAHFSFWNCDYGGPIINLDVAFQDANGQPLIGMQVNITATLINDTRYSTTNTNGAISGGMPYNSPLVIEVLDDCGTVLYTMNAGPYTTNTSLGTITIPGTIYSGSVSGQVVDCNNNPIPGAVVYYTLNGVYHSVTAPNGNFSIPFTGCAAGGTVNLNAQASVNGYWNTNTTPITVNLVAGSNVVAGAIVVPISSNIVITGTLEDCNNNPVVSGIISYTSNTGGFTAPVVNGAFTITTQFAACGSGQVTLQGYDLSGATVQQGNPVTITVNPGNNAAGTLQACGAITTEYIQFTLDGNNYLVVPPNINCYDSTGTPAVTTISGFGFQNSGPNTQSQINFSFDGNAVGTFPISNLFFMDIVGGTTQYYQAQTPISFTTTTTQYGILGQFVDGTFSGNFTDQSSVVHSISCTYHVLKDN